MSWVFVDWATSNFYVDGGKFYAHEPREKTHQSDMLLRGWGQRAEMIFCFVEHVRAQC